MRIQDHFIDDAKAQAALTLEKLKKGPSRRKRKKRELVNTELHVETNAQSEALVTSMKVRGVESWAPIQAGSVKRVKRYGPPVEQGQSLH